MVHDTPLTKEMSDSSDESGSTPEVPPLTSLTADGKRYRRSVPVESEIGKILRLPQSKWPRAARHVQNETLVFMVRQTRCADRDLHERLVDALEKRIFLIAGRFVWGFDEDIIEDIKLEAEAQILDLVFAETPSRQSEFLEIALVEAIECRVRDAVEKYTNSTAGRCVELALEPDEDSDDIERPIELIALDYGPSPEDIVLQKEAARLRFETLKKAFSYVKVFRHLEAFMLHYGEGVPIQSKTGKFDLVTHFKATPRQIAHWLATAKKQMRTGLGVESIPPIQVRHSFRRSAFHPSDTVKRAVHSAPAVFL